MVEQVQMLCMAVVLYPWAYSPEAVLQMSPSPPTIPPEGPPYRHFLVPDDEVCTT